jgi:hypothetical protein
VELIFHQMMLFELLKSTWDLYCIYLKVEIVGGLISQ